MLKFSLPRNNRLQQAGEGYLIKYAWEGNAVLSADKRSLQTDQTPQCFVEPVPVILPSPFLSMPNNTRN